MKNFTTRNGALFYSYALDKEKAEEMDFYLRFLEDSGIRNILERSWNSRGFKGGRPPYEPCNMFATLLYGFCFDSGSLRDLEDKCRYDLRYRYLMDQEEPSYVTFSNFINSYILPFKDEVFYILSMAIISYFNIYPEDCFIDGTKIEADANRYKFVWKPTSWHLKLCDEVREILGKYDLLRNIPSNGLIDSKLIAKKLSALDDLKQDKDDKELSKDIKRFLSLLDRALDYEEKERICGDNRKSYFKTDHDATAMCLKDDYYAGLGSSMHAAYNLQIMVCHGIVISYYVSQSRNDIKDMIPTLERFLGYTGICPKSICADAGYGSYENWKWLDEHGVLNYVKHSSWQGNVSGGRPDLYTLESEDYIICLGQKKGYPAILTDRHPKKQGSVFYEVQGCTGCEFMPYCRKYMSIKEADNRIFEVFKDHILYKQESEYNLLSVKGIEMRVNRSSQVEGVFGILKEDMEYTRLNRTGMDKVSLELSLKLLGYNIRKLFRYYQSGALPDYWCAPSDLEPEEFKKPRAKILSRKATKAKIKSVNQKAKSEYKY